MGRSLRGRQMSGAQKTSKSFLASLMFLASLINRLAGLIKLTEEGREGAGFIMVVCGMNKYS